MYANPPDWPHMLVWERRIQQGDLFVDVGANIGNYSVLCVSLGANVIAIEPAKETVIHLKQNNALNGDLIEIIEAAVGDSSKVARFTVGQDQQNHLDPTGEEAVAMMTLDTIIGQRTVAGLKLDVEGYELDALRGASEALRDHRIHLLQIEWNSLAPRDPIEELLSGWGYEFFEPTASGDLVPFRPQGPGPDLFAAAPGVVV